MRLRTMITVGVMCLTQYIQGGNTNLRDSLQVALLQLDKLVEQREELHAGHDFMLDSLRREMERATDPWKKYHLCGSLFYENLHYQADSSLYYIGKKEELLPRLGRPDLQNEIRINRAEALGVKGNYSEVQDELQSIRPMELEKGLRQYYYSTYCNYYNWLSSFTVDRELRQHYFDRANAYRDSILQLLPQGVNHDIVFSNLLLQSNEPDSVICILARQLEAAREPKERTYLHYNLSEAYAAKGDTLSQMYHLAQTAILDMRLSVREYSALPALALQLYNQGDLERAYRYADCAMRDAEACNSHLRFMEGGRFFPFIHATLLGQVREQYSRAQHVLLVTAVLLILLVVAVACLAWWMKKLAEMRSQLEVANQHLQASNQQLKETGKIKETYIAYYLDRCVGDMEKKEQYRRSLEKLAMAQKTAELYKMIRSEEFLRKERRDFYQEFDRSFLALFPNFIDDLNKLLVDEGKLYPRQDEQLSTELRIYALIRLGVTNAERIAHFLGCSLTTIYNYRSKTRNRALGDKEHFEEEVMKL